MEQSRVKGSKDIKRVGGGGVGQEAGKGSSRGGTVGGQSCQLVWEHGSEDGGKSLHMHDLLFRCSPIKYLHIQCVREKEWAVWGGWRECHSGICLSPRISMSN